MSEPKHSGYPLARDPGHPEARVSRGSGSIHVDAVVIEGRAVRAVAPGRRVSKSWVSELVGRYREGGYEALAPRSKRPRRPFTHELARCGEGYGLPARRAQLVHAPLRSARSRRSSIASSRVTARIGGMY